MINFSNVDDVDLFVGMIAENAGCDSLIGETFSCIIAKQFDLLKRGDKFFFTHTGVHCGFSKSEEAI